MDAEKFHKNLMRMGKWTGCHQKSDRSFYVRTYQFPICARCTGVLIGQIVAFPLYFVIPPSGIILVLFCGIMFMDWLLQDKKICESTNLRRIITGILGGYALMSIYIIMLKFLFGCVGIL